MIQLLLKHNPCINKMGGVGTALQVACMQSNNLAVTVMLVQAGADVNSSAQRWHGSTALQAAILSQDMDAVDYLIGKGANVSDRPGIVLGLTALQAAVKTQNTPLVKRLMNLRADANENFSRLRHETSVELAVRCGNLELFDLLVNNGVYNDVQAELLAWYKKLLLYAIDSGSHAMVERVIAAGAKTGLQDAIRNSQKPDLLAAAIKHERDMFETVQRLLIMGASPDACGDDLETPLQLAARHSTLDLVQLLVKKGADVNLTHNRSSSAFVEAIRRQDESMVDFLIEAGSCVHAKENDDAQAALIVAASTGNLNIVRKVLDAMKRNSTGLLYIDNLSLTKAVRSNKPEVVRFLLDSTPEVQIGCSKFHSCYMGPLSQAIEGKNYDIINMLLEYGIAYYSRDSLALVYAARIGDIQLLKRLLLLKFDFEYSIIEIFPIYNKALRQTVSHQRTDVAKALIAAGADINVAWAKCTGPSFVTCMLNESIIRKSLEMVKFLLDNGAHVNGPKALQVLRLEAKRTVLTPLQCAVKLGDSTVMQLLLDSGADVHTPASGLQKNTLEIAAENGRLDMVHKLLKLDKQPETLKERIEKAASHAMRNDYPVVAQYLMDWQQFN